MSVLVALVLHTTSRVAGEPCQRPIISRYTTNYWHARKTCEALGGHLPIIHKSSENSDIHLSIKHKVARGVWLDLSDAAEEGEWRWADGSVANFTNWAPHQPDSHKHSVENRCNMWVQPGSAGLWNDNPSDDNTIHVLCCGVTSDKAAHGLNESEYSRCDPCQYSWSECDPAYTSHPEYSVKCNGWKEETPNFLHLLIGVVAAALLVAFCRWQVLDHSEESEPSVSKTSWSRQKLLILCVFTTYVLVHGVLSWQYWHNAVVWQRTFEGSRSLTLPRLYFCPAGASQRQHLGNWIAYECALSYRGNSRPCEAKVVEYSGYPDNFGGGHGRCLEFQSDSLRVETEWSSAWNELRLRAVFDEARTDEDVAWDEAPSAEHAKSPLELDEVELGVGFMEWELHNRQDIDTFYYPLRRVPIFSVGQTAGVATRAFLGREEEIRLRGAGVYWYSYGAQQLPIRRSAFPRSVLKMQINDTAAQRQKKQKEVDVLLTVEDFDTHVRRYIAPPALYPVLVFTGEAAGFTGLLILFLRRSAHNGIKSSSFAGELRSQEDTDGECTQRLLNTADDL